MKAKDLHPNTVISLTTEADSCARKAYDRHLSEEKYNSLLVRTRMTDTLRITSVNILRDLIIAQKFIK